MRSRVLAVFCLFAEAACSSSSGSDQRDAYAGDWVGQGLSVWTWSAPTYAPAPEPAANAVTVPMLMSFGALSFTADTSGVVGVAGVIPPFPDPVPMQKQAGGLMLTSPFTVSGPAPAACADTPCQDRTDVLTVTGGWAAVSDGTLSVALTGERVLCCTSATFTVAFTGTSGGEAAPR